MYTHTREKICTKLIHSVPNRKGAPTPVILAFVFFSNLSFLPPEPMTSPAWSPGSITVIEVPSIGSTGLNCSAPASRTGALPGWSLQHRTSDAKEDTYQEESCTKMAGHNSPECSDIYRNQPFKSKFGALRRFLKLSLHYADVPLWCTRDRGGGGGWWEGRGPATLWRVIIEDQTHQGGHFRLLDRLQLWLLALQELCV